MTTPAGEVRFWKILLCAGLSILAVAVAGAFWVVHRLPPFPDDPPVRLHQRISIASPSVPMRFWSVFRTASDGRPMAAPEVSSSDGRYRLAGTFIAMGSATANGEIMRKAILDDLKSGRQFLAGEDEMAGDARVLRVLEDRVWIQYENRSVELAMAFRGDLARAPAASASTTSDSAAPPLETSAFGRRVMENRWRLSREAISGYYREMLDQPERVAKLYESFEPVYAEGRVAGYRLNVKGEASFLDAVGLKQGDVVRQVNSMNMTSQSRAEFFIGEFLKERLSAIVLDLERDNAPRKQVYLVD